MSLTDHAAEQLAAAQDGGEIIPIADRPIILALCAIADRMETP